MSSSFGSESRTSQKSSSFEEYSLGFLSRDLYFRKLVISIITHKFFERFILFVIALNSLFLGLSDYSHVNVHGELIQEGSWRNTLIGESEIIFTIIFTVECGLKIIGMGFYGNKGYLKDRWNWLDFIVVLTGWISFIPEIPNVSIIRTFRVLRPLKSISTNPGLQSLVLAILNSIPELMGVLVLLLFIFLLFGITGLQLFSGPSMHARCRLTPHPVDLLWVPGASAEDHRCLPVSNFNTRGDASWTKRSSPWSTPQDCFWPIAPSSSIRLCSFGHEGMNSCLHQPPLNESEWTWCGANYDATGNPRFKSKAIMEEATFLVELNWGYTNFDNIGTAFLTIFQCITLEGWADIMYQVQDSVSEPLAAVIFVFLILFGTFFCLNLVLAVLEDNFIHTRENETSSSTLRRVIERALHKYIPDLPLSDSFQEFRKKLRHIVNTSWFSHSVTTLIVLNTIVLSLTHYPDDQQFENVLDACNFLFSLLFGLEMTLKIVGYGLTKYLLVPENVFDAVIVIISFAEVVTSPPVYFGGQRSSSSGAISALRSFRLFRILKLFSKWQSMKTLLGKVLKTVLDLGNFALLLSLFLYIYTLIGMQFFANRFRFGEDGHPYEAIGSEEWKSAEDWSRSNFDDFPHSFATVFQILSTENWNMVLYDCRRSIGPLSMIFPCTIIIFGNYIFMNLFLAILIGNFSNDSPKTNEKNKAENGEGEEDGEGEGDSNNDEETYSKYQNNKKQSPQQQEQQQRRQRLQQQQSPQSSDPQELEMISSSVKSTSRIPIQIKPSQSEKLTKANRKINQKNKSSAKILAIRDDDDGAVEAAVVATVTTTPTPTAMATAHNDQTMTGSLSQQISKQQQRHHQLQQEDQELPSSEDEKLESFSHTNRQITPDMTLPQETVDENQPSPVLAAPVEPHRTSENTDNEDEEEDDDDDDNDDDEDEGFGSQMDREKSYFASNDLAKINSLGLFSSTHPLRRTCITMIHDPWFDRIILSLIVISSVTLALDNPLLNPDSILSRSLDVVDIVLTLIFSCEMVIKIIALGLVMHPGAYLRSSWNCLDCFVVIISFVGIFSGSKSLVSLRALRSLRGLRPLRVINRAPGLKLVVNAVLASIPDVINVAGLCFLFFLIFSIFGVNYFKGQLRHCTGEIFREYVSDSSEYMTLLTHPKPWDHLSSLEQSYFGPNSTIPMTCNGYNYPQEPCCSSYSSHHQVITSKMICECWGATWDLIDIYNFDNVGGALLSLFQMSTTEGWVTLMYLLVDTAGIHMQPIRDNHVEWIFFSIFFMLVASYLALNLFVGVVIDNFKRMKQKLDGNLAFLTPEQQEWIKTQDIARRIKPAKKPVRPIALIPGMIFDVCYHPWFEWFIHYCILFNTLFMAMYHFGQGHLYERFLESMNIIFAGIFTFEAVIKIIALHENYFYDSWNQYDFFIVLGTNAGLIYRWVAGSNVGLTVTVFRTFRIARILRLMNGTESISQLINTLILTLPGLGNIAALLFLLFFIFAVTGIQLFAKVGYHGSYNEHANFRDFSVALLTLLRFATGESWNSFMFDASRKPDDCLVDPDYDANYCGFNNHKGCLPLNGCGNMSIFPYLITFMIVMSVVFINLFVGVILEGFSFSNDESGAAVKPEDFMKFADHWAKFDPHASCYISIRQLEEFVQSLGPPLGFGKSMKRKELSAKISKLPLHIHPGKVVHFKDVLSALSTDAICRASKSNEAGMRLANFVDQMFKTETVQKKKLGGYLNELAARKQQYTMEHFYAVKLIEGPCAQLIKRIKAKRAAEALNPVPDPDPDNALPGDLFPLEPDRSSPVTQMDPPPLSPSSPVDPFVLPEDNEIPQEL